MLIRDALDFSCQVQEAESLDVNRRMLKATKKKADWVQVLRFLGESKSKVSLNIGTNRHNPF